MRYSKFPARAQLAVLNTQTGYLRDVLGHVRFVLTALEAGPEGRARLPENFSIAAFIENLEDAIDSSNALLRRMPYPADWKVADFHSGIKNAVSELRAAIRRLEDFQNESR